MCVNHTQPDVIRQTECTELRPRRQEGGDEMASIMQDHVGKKGKRDSEETKERKKENMLLL